MTQEKDSIAKAPRGRVQRVPVGTRNILTVKGKDPNYVYRFVNDVDDRVQQFLDAGYVFEDDGAVDVGDKRVNSTSSLGTNKSVSVGQGTKAFVMKQKREWFEEDQARKLSHVAEIERSTKEKALDGTYGDLKLNRD